MRIDSVKVGMKLKIVKIDETDAAFTSGSDMRDMVGDVFEVTSVNMDTYDVRLGGWSWHPADLEMADYEMGDEVSDAMDQQKTLFNPDELLT